MAGAAMPPRGGAAARTTSRAPRSTSTRARAAAAGPRGVTAAPPTRRCRDAATDSVTFAFGDPAARALRARAARARARTGRCAPRQRAGAAVLRPRAGRGARAGRPRRCRRTPAGRRSALAGAARRRSRRRSTAGRSRFDAEDGQGFALDVRGARRAGGARRRRRPRSAGWRATTSRAACAGTRPRRRARAGDRRARPARPRVGRPRLGADRAGADGDGVDRRRLRRADRDPARPARATTPTRRRGRRCGSPRGCSRSTSGRLSTTYDADGHTRRAGLELWPAGDEEWARRGGRRGAVRLVARPRLAAARLRVLPLAPRGPRRRRALRHPAPRRVIRAVVSDFGGVLTAPLLDGFARIQADLGVPPAAFGSAIANAERGRRRATRCTQLEVGAIAEDEFLAVLERELEAGARPRRSTLHGFGERYMAGLDANDALFAYYRDLHARGVRLAMLTNNVREWEPHWRTKLPIDEIFETVVDSGFVGVRKPDPAIYAIVLERLGLPAEACVFVDDLELNVDAARDARLRGRPPRRHRRRRSRRSTRCCGVRVSPAGARRTTPPRSARCTRRVRAVRRRGGHPRRGCARTATSCRRSRSSRRARTARSPGTSRSAARGSTRRAPRCSRSAPIGVRARAPAARARAPR